ncbi:BamA/TamA family outer membrane protein [Flammeovirga sp. SubArs3]|uniref:BamA/TamA family outer membrane protein n=1 Tax=Flammeovirga sp. SubArs3 TaxID=2995316 RepID=UPI00248B1BB8|nr:BamA/TamA family outer membrane protein [Flammeovirga sp. SubArs3]
MKKLLFLLLFSFTFSLQQSIAQSFSTGGGGSAERSDKNFQFMPVPYINYDRTLGLSVGALPMAMYNLSKTDTISPSSISGALGLYTTNKSWFTLGFSKFYFAEDRYRVTVAGGVGDFNYQTYVGFPLNGFLQYATGVNFIKGEIQRKVIKNLYAGVNYMYTDFENSFDIAPDTTSTVQLQTLGFIISYDHRDDVYYPTKGEIGNVNIDVSPEFLGNDQPNTKITIDFNKYFAFKNGRDILATRMYVGFGVGDLTFNQQFIVGQSDIRGYTQAKYRGNAMYNIQVEYRWNFHKKMAVNFFAGLATVSGANDSSQNGILLPGVGVGYRYNVFPKNHMNVGLDAAVGRDDWGIYFRIGEAF